MCEEAAHIDLAVGNEGGALTLADRRKRPGTGTYQCHLPAQEIWANVECNVAALSDETSLAPSANALDAPLPG